MTERMAASILQLNGQVVAEPTMDVSHVASAVLYITVLPLDANVQFMTVMAIKLPYIDRPAIHRPRLTAWRPRCRHRPRLTAPWRPTASAIASS
ncbi:hypothetical protein IHE33_05080 [Mycetohabitans endofungorum]